MTGVHIYVNHCTDHELAILYIMKVYNCYNIMVYGVYSYVALVCYMLAFCSLLLSVHPYC